MKRVWTVSGLVLAVSVALDIVLRHYAHPEFWWHTIPAFDLVYGFLGCAGLIYVSKWLGHTFLARDEDYYERDR